MEVHETFELQGQVALASANSSGGTREIRAVFTDTTVRVYQAYNAEIADAAVQAQRFVPPWKPGRMTWIKPSAIWMGYRCGWAAKDKNQARVLAVDLHRHAFDGLLREAVVASHQAPREERVAPAGADHSADVIVQWDPERALGGPDGKDALTHPLPAQRSLQMGLRGDATHRYAAEGGLIARITDVTELFTAVRAQLAAGSIEAALALLPTERPYPVPGGCTVADREDEATAAARAQAASSAADGQSGSELRSLKAGPYYTPGYTHDRAPHRVPLPALRPTAACAEQC